MARPTVQSAGENAPGDELAHALRRPLTLRRIAFGAVERPETDRNPRHLDRVAIPDMGDGSLDDPDRRQGGQRAEIFGETLDRREADKGDRRDRADCAPRREP